MRSHDEVPVNNSEEYASLAEKSRRRISHKGPVKGVSVASMRRVAPAKDEPDAISLDVLGTGQKSHKERPETGMSQARILNRRCLVSRHHDLLEMIQLRFLGTGFLF